jgi:hypothetical protein
VNIRTGAAKHLNRNYHAYMKIGQYDLDVRDGHVLMGMLWAGKKPIVEPAVPNKIRTVS